MSVDKTVKISDRVTGRYVATFGCSQSVYCLKFSAADLCGTTGGCVGRSSIMAIFHTFGRGAGKMFICWYLPLPVGSVTYRYCFSTNHHQPRF